MVHILLKSLLAFQSNYKVNVKSHMFNNVEIYFRSLKLLFFFFSFLFKSFANKSPVVQELLFVSITCPGWTLTFSPTAKQTRIAYGCIRVRGGCLLFLRSVA